MVLVSARVGGESIIDASPGDFLIVNYGPLPAIMPDMAPFFLPKDAVLEFKGISGGGSFWFFNWSQVIRIAVRIEYITPTYLTHKKELSE